MYNYVYSFYYLYKNIKSLEKWKNNEYTSIFINIEKILHKIILKVIYTHQDNENKSDRS